MATLSKHGEKIGEIEYIHSKIAVMSDGKLLKNSGYGWKLWHKCKPDCTPQQAYEARLAALERRMDACPAWAEFRQLMRAEFSFTHRGLVHTIIDSMPQDPDGCWSELNDYANIPVDIDTMVKLCQLWTEAEKELKAYKANLKSEQPTAQPVAA